MFFVLPSRSQIDLQMMEKSILSIRWIDFCFENTEKYWVETIIGLNFSGRIIADQKTKHV